MSLITSFVSKITDPAYSALSTQSKKEAKRLLKHFKSVNQVAISSLSEAQELVAIMKGKSSWHELIMSVSNRSGLTVKPMSDISIFSGAPNKLYAGDMHIGTSETYGEAVITSKLAANHTIIFGENDVKRSNFLTCLADDTLKTDCGLVWIGEQKTSRLSRRYIILGSKEGRSVKEFNFTRQDNIKPEAEIFSVKSASWVKKIITSALRGSFENNTSEAEMLNLTESLIDLNYYLHFNNKEDLSVSSVAHKFDLNLNFIIKHANNEDIPDEIRKNLTYIVTNHSRFKNELLIIYSMILDINQYLIGVYVDRFLQSIDKKDFIIVHLPSEPSAKSNIGKFLMAIMKDYISNLINKGTLKNNYKPVKMIFDGYSDYVIEGLSMMLAQARSHGIQMIFADKNFNNSIKYHSDEINSIIANCNIFADKNFNNSIKYHSDEINSIIANCNTKIFLDNESDRLIEISTEEEISMLAYDEANVLVGRSLHLISKVIATEY